VLGEARSAGQSSAEAQTVEGNDLPKRDLKLTPLHTARENRAPLPEGRALTWSSV
jgi:hypothetical protein